ncbi:hypothetical protein AYJ57_20820 (plasmid) [Salipiger sp. CCB-MM3]|uniref:response regulator n=1 Tax=Salipiger sp. CCB-MM3 TaxID=1792508 RepID=UPI00080AB8B9|nr:response regulator [Salipiger sp. CCB-MM3]ANT62924.1 hypothetical protein AYJ57_20820 [Salipiger sp. CCB-MM3]
MLDRNTEPLGAPTVLICEDEAIIALDLKYQVEDMGYRVIGPVATVAAGLEALKGECPDAAILDVRLREGDVIPLAEELEAMGVGLMFQSGHAIHEEVLDRFPQAQFCNKPLPTGEIDRSLKVILKPSMSNAA